MQFFEICTPSSMVIGAMSPSPAGTSQMGFCGL
jgi:hypothetical protein